MVRALLVVLLRARIISLASGTPRVRGQLIRLSTDIEYRPDRPHPYRARVRWTDPVTKRRLSLAEGKADEDEAQEWLADIIEAAQARLSPSLATMKLAEHGDANRELALRGLEAKTLDPDLAGWRTRVVPALGHLAVRMITNGVVDRADSPGSPTPGSRSTSCAGSPATAR
ncbi:hypothetical protein [Streptomyces sp. NPDC057877]|uniref:hypothetical protein n=1 Tax=Streptomyces sp. NPDC057877 TaxID=3346269 RepID=UPI0036C6DF4D